MYGKTIIVVVLILSLLYVFATSAGEFDESLLLALSFDEGRGDMAKDSSINGYHGSVDGAIWERGRFGRALKFDGVDDFVSVPDSPDLRFLNNKCTLMAWIKLEGQGSSVWPRIFCKEEQTGSNGGFHMPIDWNGGIKLRFVIDGSDGYTSSEPLELGKWYHTAVTCDGNNTLIYIDGVLIFQGPQERPFPDADPELRIGNSPAGPRPFKGWIDEARIWSRPLNAGEIQAQMNISTPILVSVEPLKKLASNWSHIKSSGKNEVILK
jgi:hypothetical protein